MRKLKLILLMGLRVGMILHLIRKIFSRKNKGITLIRLRIIKMKMKKP